MNNQQLRSATSQHKFTLISVIALFLVVAIVAGLLSPHRDVPSVYLNIIAGIGIVAGLLGLYIAFARRFDLWLPLFLRVEEESQDQFWRLLAMSVAIIAFPLIVIMMQRVLFH